jgi:hypothetical protein
MPEANILDLLFSPRTLTETAIKRKAVPRLMQYLFFKRRHTHLTRDIDLRNVAYPLKVLPMVGERSGAVVIEGTKRALKIVPSARFRPKRVSGANELLYVTAPGEPVELKQGMGNVEERLKSAIVSDIDILNDSLELSIELLCSELLRTGKVVAHDDDGVDYEVDFGLPAAHTVVLTGTDLWTDAASDPIEILEECSSAVQDACGRRPNVVVHGTGAWQAFRKNKAVKDELNNRNIDSGTMRTAIGELFKGNIGNVGHYVYGGSYDDTHGNSRELFPSDYILMGCTDAPCSVEFGLPADLANTGPVEKFVKTVIEDDPSHLAIIEESRPLPVADLDYFCFVKVR